jgi:hypothetical protein
MIGFVSITSGESFCEGGVKSGETVPEPWTGNIAEGGIDVMELVRLLLLLVESCVLEYALFEDASLDAETGLKGVEKSSEFWRYERNAAVLGVRGSILKEVEIEVEVDRRV